MKLLVGCTLALTCLILWINTHQCSGRSIRLPRTQGSPQYGWSSESGTLDEWYRCAGMSAEKCQRTKEKLMLYKKMLAIATKGTAEGVELDDNLFGGCIVFTEEQLDIILAGLPELMSHAINGTSGGRHDLKRSITNFKQNPASKWSMPIYYKFDGTHSEYHRTVIRSGFQQWMDNTCVRFVEIPQNVQSTVHHIIVTSQDGCYSVVGQFTDQQQQPLNLGNACVAKFGTVVHEIGHTIGLWHQQMRPDRDETIQVMWDNIIPNYISQFTIMPDTLTFDVPYDVGSVMHYSTLDSVSKNNQNTMIAKDPYQQMNMGQRTGLSFYDIQLINKNYCSDTCKKALDKACAHRGYQNPNDCSKCMCPDGFSGQYCDDVAPPRNAQCGGVINIQPGQQEVITSPGYDDTKYYFSQQECSWWFKAPKDHKIKLTFDGQFGMYCAYSSCYHWVEIKYKEDLGLPGGRFCCYKNPETTVVSESNEMMIIFKSNYTVNVISVQRGFKALVSIESIGKIVAPPQPSSAVLWSCSFEKNSTPNQLCGMRQDDKDKFDWDIFTGPTPSDPTGPDAAYDGEFYIYIEASNRQPNDEARIFLPQIGSFSGDVCLSFYYHMYGFHTKELKLVQITSGSQKTIWSKTKEIGNLWNKASVGVSIQPGSELQFVGVRGDEFSGDIGLDKLEMKSGAC